MCQSNLNHAHFLDIYGTASALWGWAVEEDLNRTCFTAHRTPTLAPRKRFWCCILQMSATVPPSATWSCQADRSRRILWRVVMDAKSRLSSLSRLEFPYHPTRMPLS